MTLRHAWAMGTPMTPLLPAVELDTGPAPRHALLWLHGLGADGHDFAPIVPELARGLPPMRCIFPHAPYRAVTLNGGMRVRAWYDIRGIDLGHRVDNEGLQQSVAQARAWLESLHEVHGIPPSRQLLAGFSQGGAVALAAALALDQPLAGVVALSTYLPQTAIPSTVAPMRQIFMAHGSFDPIVPQSLGEAACAQLRSQGHSVEWHSYPMPHAVLPQEIADLRAWLVHRVGS